MSNAGAIKGGGVFVEIGADPRKFFAALNKVNKAMGDMGRSVAGAGAKIGGIGVATLAPFAAAVRQGTAYQSTLLNIQASTGATAQELDRLKAASMQMSQAMGVGPTQIAGSFLELLKAGMSVEQVLGGAGQAAIEFATVGQMDVAAAGVVMADAMKVFGVSADTAANAISSAADASSTSIEGMSQAFSQVSAVAALANQSIGDTSAALAILANAGVKGSDAGTSLKTMLLRLMAPADEAVDSLKAIGLSVASFRNANGSMKPLVEIIRTLNKAMGGMNQAAKDDIFKNIFGQDAIRAAAILTSTGVDGFNAMTGAMAGAMPVGEKFKTMMSGLAGAAGTIMAALERFAIAVSDAVGPALMSVVTPLLGFINGLTDLASKNKEAVATFAKFAVGAVVVGGALTGIGLALQGLSFSFGGILKAFSLVTTVVGVFLSPLGLVIAGLAALAIFGPQIKDALGGAFSGVGEVIGKVSGFLNGLMAGAMTLFSDLKALAGTTFDGIYDALSSGDIVGAMKVLWAGLEAIWLRGIQTLVNSWYTAVGEIKKAFVTIGGAWDKYVTKPMSMLGVRVAEAGQERQILGAFDTTQGTIFDNESKKAARARKKTAEDLLASSTAEDFDKNKTAAKSTIDSLQRTVDAGMADGATDEQKKAGEAAAKEIEAYRNAIQLVKERFAQLGIQTEEQRHDALDKAKAEIDAATKASIDANNAAVAEAESRLNTVTRDSADARARGQQAEDLGANIANVGTMDGLRGLADEFHTLKAAGRLTSEQESKLAGALDSATERLMGEGAMIDPAKAAEQGAGGAGLGGPSQAEVAGTFSSVALGGMGFGSSLAQKQVDLLGKIEQNTRESDGATVAA